MIRRHLIPLPQLMIVVQYHHFFLNSGKAAKISNRQNVLSAPPEQAIPMKSSVSVHFSNAFRARGAIIPWGTRPIIDWPARRDYPAGQWYGSSCLGYLPIVSWRYHFLRHAGTFTEPSACKLFSKIAAKTRGIARADPFNVCTGRGLPSFPRNLMFARLAWKSVKLLQLDTSNQRFCDRPYLQVILLRVWETNVSRAYE